MNFNLPSDMAPIGLLVFIAFWIATVAIHVMFAIAVYRDAASLNLRGTGTVFVSPFIWCLSVLIGGVFLAGIYWLIHHSMFRRTEPISGNPEPYMWQPPPGSDYHNKKEFLTTETSVNEISETA
jgi:hypothetical protein